MFKSRIQQTISKLFRTAYQLKWARPDPAKIFLSRIPPQYFSYPACRLDFMPQPHPAKSMLDPQRSEHIGTA